MLSSMTRLTGILSTHNLPESQRFYLLSHDASVTKLLAAFSLLLFLFISCINFKGGGEIVDEVGLCSMHQLLSICI